MSEESQFPSHVAIFEKVVSLEGKFELLAARFFDHEQQEVTAREERREERRNDREDRKAVIERLGKVEEVLHSVQAAQNQNIGRDGVLAALLRSPFVAWLTAIGVAIAAWVSTVRDGG